MRRAAVSRAASSRTRLPAAYDPAEGEVRETHLVDGELRSATLSRCGSYRYRLSRRWGDGPALAWLLQNPSTADWREDDQTVRRGRHFTRAAGYAAMEFVNLWALRETDSAAFLRVLREDPRRAEGPGNASHLLAAAVLCPGVVCAWGGGPGRAGADRLLDLLNLGVLRGGRLLCLGVTANGAPLHPSRLGNDRALRRYDPWGESYLLPF